MIRILFIVALAAGFAGAKSPDDQPTRPRIEVAFALDATGSMGSCIAEARQRIKGIATDLASGDPAPDVRFGLVSFRDRGDAYVTRKHDFTGDLDKMRANLDATHAKGGGDTPEAVVEALEVAIKALSWRLDDDTVRLLYLVGDAPPQRYPDGPDPEALLRLALQKGIVIHSITCGHMAQSGRAFFERFARLSEGRVIDLKNGGRGGKAGPSLGAAVRSTARAYSDSVGVDYAATSPVAVEAADFPPVAESGLIGGHARMIADPSTWTDVWAAHTSLGDTRQDPPSVDFSTHHVLVLGGADAGLQLVDLVDDGGRRIARVEPGVTGVQFRLVPASTSTFTAVEGADR